MKIHAGEILAEHYEIRAELGEGGFGTVYRALDQTLKREVALKILKSSINPDGDDYDRFLRESKYLGRLSHPNIVQVFAIELLNNTTPFIVMEFVPGLSLKGFLNEKNGRLTFDESQSIFAQICAALAHAHGQNIVHRDLSSANVLLVDPAGKLLVKMIDFGLSKVVSDPASTAAGDLPTRALTRVGALIGNPLYMSPEACRGEPIDFSSDIYSLGCLLYEMITGAPPLDALEPIGILYKHQNEYPAEPTFSWRNAEQEQLYKSVCLLCLQKEKDKRPASVAAIMELLSQSQPLPPLLKDTHGWGSESHSRKETGLSLNLIGIASALVFVLLGAAIAYKYSHAKPAGTAVTITRVDDQIELKSLLLSIKQKKIRFGTRHKFLISPTFALAKYYYRREDSRSTIKELEEVLALMEYSHSYGVSEGANVFDVMKMLANCFIQKGQLERAEQVTRRAVELVASREGKDNPIYVFWLRRLGFVYTREGKNTEAESCLRESIARAEHTDDETLAETELNVGEIYSELHRHAEAQKHLRKTLLLAENLSGVEAGRTGDVKFMDGSMASLCLSAYALLGKDFIDQREFDKADSIFSQAIEIVEHAKNLTDRETEQIRFLELRADCKVALEQNAEALSQIREAQRIIESHFSGPTKMRQLQILAQYLFTAGDFSGAIAVNRQRLSMAENSKDFPRWKYLDCKENLAFTYLIEGDSKMANNLYKQILSETNNPFFDDHWHEGSWQGHYALSCLNLGNVAEAEKYFLRALAQMQMVHPPDSGQLEIIKFGLAKVYARQNRRAETEKLLKDSIENGFKTGDNKTLSEIVIFAATNCRETKGDLLTAEANLKKVLKRLSDSKADKVLKRNVYMELSNCEQTQGHAIESKEYSGMASHTIDSSSTDSRHQSRVTAKGE